MKRSTLLVSLITMATLLFTGCDSTSSGDGVTRLTVGGVPRNMTLQPGAEHLYSFAAESGVQYRIYTDSDDGTDTYMVLYNGTNTSDTLEENDDTEYSGIYQYASEIRWTAPTTGTYYFMVCGYSATEAGPYSVAVDSLGSSSSNTITVDAPAINGVLGAGDEHYYTFNAVAGTTYTMFTDGNLDTYMSLYQLGSLTATIETDDDSGPGYNGLIQFTPSVSGSYTFMVEGYDETETGTYTVEVTTGTPPAAQSRSVETKNKLPRETVKKSK